MNLFKKLSAVLLVASTFACHTQASVDTNKQTSVYPEYKNIDQSFVYFKAIDGAKYPYMAKVQPALNQVDMVLCGTEQDGLFWTANTANDLENLTVLRHTMKFADNGTQIDKKAPGYRDAVMAIIFEGYFKALGLMPSGEYKGTVLVDEYCKGFPMKWVLSSINEFKALEKYLTKNFKNKNVVPLANKPLLLVEFVKATTLDADDKAFLNTYFTLLDNDDQDAKTFFEQSQTQFDNIMDATKDAKIVAESFGETLMRNIETSSGDLDMKKITTIVLGFVVGGICFKKFINWLTSGIENGISNTLNPKPAIPEDQKPINKGDIDRLITAVQGNH